MKNPNEVWKKFDFFIRGKLKHVPEGFVYSDLSKYEEEKRDQVILLTLELMVKNEANRKLGFLLGEWRDFCNE